MSQPRVFVFDRQEEFDEPEVEWPLTGHITDREIRKIRPENLTSEEECAEAWDRLGGMADDIEAQLERAQAHFNDTGEKADPQWLINARRALKAARAARQVAQTRRGDLRRSRNAEERGRCSQETVVFDRAFVKACYRALPETQLKVIEKLAAKLIEEAQSSLDRASTRPTNP